MTDYRSKKPADLSIWKLLTIQDQTSVGAHSLTVMKNLTPNPLGRRQPLGLADEPKPDHKNWQGDGRMAFALNYKRNGNYWETFGAELLLGQEGHKSNDYLDILDKGNYIGMVVVGLKFYLTHPMKEVIDDQKRGERTSVINSHSKKRKTGDRRKIGLGAVGIGYKNEFEAGEADNGWINQYGAKYLRKGGLKLPEVLKDMLLNSMKKQRDASKYK
ncbi:11407_t:CDS:2 [Acaulospora colombiana]|uniref:11407_t:CDS:1 n=1 Tax=Acaulospora colombiana TaxID=27376 RepID=A0ACA9MMN9_9GLOM|nr:11407_t:CDS:2 [Acaulospora colombiana]